MFSTRTLRVRRRRLDRAVLAVVAAAGVSSAMTLGAPAVAEACMSVGYAAPPVTVAPAPGSRAYIRFDSYATFGGSAGQYCACALRAFPGLFSTVNAVSILGVGGFSFRPSPTTSTSAGSALGSSASASWRASQEVFQSESLPRWSLTCPSRRERPSRISRTR